MFELTLLLLIILAALVLFVGGWLSVDLVGLLVLSALALTGLVDTGQALAGFSSPAVVTVWAMFILSAGLSRTGVAYRLGEPLQRFAKSGEWVIVAVLMAAASLLSALINTITVAVILLPAAMDLARRSGLAPSRLLLPMALGCLLGGPFTGISTPPNMLVTDALRNAGLVPFGLFDFTPITGAIVLSGIVFVVLAGRRLLPRRQAQQAPTGSGQAEASYQLDSHVFPLDIPPGSPLVGRTLSAARLGSALSLTVLALRRRGQMRLAPRPTERIEPGDTLVVHGPTERFHSFVGSEHLLVDPESRAPELLSCQLLVARARVAPGSPLTGRPLAQSTLRREHRVHVLALEGAGPEDGGNLLHRPLGLGDGLLLLGAADALDGLARQGLVEEVRIQGCAADADAFPAESFMSVRVPSGSVLTGHSLADSRLGNAFGLSVVGIVRHGALQLMPAPEDLVQAEDTLVLHGARDGLDVFRGLQDLVLAPAPAGLSAQLESLDVCVSEVLLSPRTGVVGKTLAELLFRDHYGLSVLAIWRKGGALRAGIQDIPLQFGDALLVYGPRKNLEAVSRDADFLVLDQAAAQAPRLEKAPVAAIIMASVVVSAILGLVPISIAALTGAALMVLLGCLSMEEAYHAIEWKVVFLIASMLPLGVALESTGAAQMGASALISLVGDLGPRWVVGALFLVTTLATQVIPTAALVVLMSPVALDAAASLGMSPHLLMMTVAMGASASFASPLSHPAHLLVMGPGGYRFTDYVKIGLPLTLIVMLVCVWLLPLLWPA